MADDAFSAAFGSPPQASTPSPTVAATPKVASPAHTASQPSSDAFDAAFGNLGTGTTKTAPAKTPAAKPDASVSVNNVVRQAATGVPIIGGLLNKADAATDAALAPLLNPLFAPQNRLVGDTFADRYRNALAIQNGQDQAFEQTHPVIATGAQLAGGMAALAPVAATATGARALGVAGDTLAQRALTGMASGAAIGGSDAAVRSGGDPDAIVHGAELGGAFGGGAPIAGRVIGAGANRLLNAVGNPLPKAAAARNLLAATAESGTTPDAIAAQLATNSRLAPMDVDPNLQQAAMNIANQPGAGRAVLSGAAQTRAQGAKNAVTGAFDEAAGETPNVQEYLDSLKQTARTNAQKGFGEALSNAKPVNVQPVLDAIDEKIMPGVQKAVSTGSDIPLGPVEQTLARVKQTLSSGDEMLTDPQRLHQLQTNLRVQADTLSKSSSGQDRLVGSALRDVRGKLVNAIDEASGGKYKPAQAQYADDLSIQDAFDKGRQILSNGTSSDAALYNRPEFWQSWVKDASPDEMQAAKLGARVAIDNQINSVRSAAAKGAGLPDVGFNRDRLEILLGKPETDRLAKLMKDEQSIASTNNKLFGGSMTAPRQAINKLTQVREVNAPIRLSAPIAGGIGYQIGGFPGAAAGLGLSLGHRGLQYLGNSMDAARNELMARALAGNAGQFTAAVAPAVRGQMIRNALTNAAGNAPMQLAPAAAAAANQRHQPLVITVRPNGY